LSYICKGLTNLRKLIKSENKEQELALRELIKDYSMKNLELFDPYSMSKVLRYLFFYNDGKQNTIELYKKFGDRLVYLI